MSIRNLKTDIVAMLTDLGMFSEISPDFPNDVVTAKEKVKAKPIAVYQTTHRPSFIDQGTEIHTNWTITIEILGDSHKGSITHEVEAVVQMFQAVRFKATARDSNLADFKRSIVEVTGTYDNILHLVYT
ncbi:hypothetical protein [Pseudolactococcus reticulitermitis]|uniref:Uncharacterized protein n=1 Tax=Pseudolactococcus reticulitermitis TaxID=2025039 RepID=A0A224WWT3_9LACT|nr:hypothetical protein [Lactococcus reticulitermitis]GAX46768.1 hypothetical protein RsY01_347 [Lactococcus reticulitermitis]